MIFFSENELKSNCWKIDHVTIKSTNSKSLFCFVISQMIMKVNVPVLLYYQQRIGDVDTFISRAFVSASGR